MKQNFSYIDFFGRFLEESSTEDDIKLKKELEIRASRVKDAKLIYIDTQNWAIGID